MLFVKNLKLVDNLLKHKGYVCIKKKSRVISQISEIGFGCMGLNHHRGPAKDRDEMIKVVHAAIEAGVTMFDTAAVYGPFINEELVGDA